MGLVLLLIHAADGLKWAQLLNGPSIAPKTFCRWPQVGPVVLVSGAADYLEWAQRCS
jgi:hypothetical protein